MRCRRTLLFSVWLSTCACGLLRGPDARLPPSTSAAAEARARIELHRVDRRPKLLLVERSGDPRAALALAIAHDLGAEASAGLSALLATRLARFSGVELRTHGLGLELAVLVRDGDQAADFVAAVDRALRSPLAAGDPVLAALPARLQALKARSLLGAADVAVASCSGELGTAVGGEGGPIGVAELDGWRRSVATVGSVGFGVVGPEAVLEATLQALRRTDDWPAGDAPEDSWPERDVLGVSRTVDGPRRLSLALRVQDGAKAVFAARSLAPSQGSLGQRLAALDPTWTLERVVATTRPRGGCLRVDLVAPSGDPGPELDTAARVAGLTFDEARRALAASPEPDWILDDSVLRPSDPREAASIGAWRTLVSLHQPGPERQFVNYVAKSADDAGDVELGRAFESVTRSWQRSNVELVQRLEAGQGELWALLATPCGTGAESSDAGLSALVVRTLADKRSQTNDVALEPWITPDGIGLLAHAPRLGPAETATAHAERIGAALGRALVATRPSGTDIAQARQSLLGELAGPRPGWSQLLQALAPDHAAWLDARGTWQSVSALVSQNVDVRRRSLGLGPLRLSVLANSDPAQAASVAGSLDRWLRAVRGEPRACANGARPTPRLGEQRVESDSESTVSAYVGASLPAATEGRAAEWTAYLLNRPGGWLEQALGAPGLVAASEALVLGGTRAQALVIAVSTLPDRTDSAVAQVRGLLQRLAQGAVTEQELKLARRHFEEQELAAALDPRRRVVDLWRGEKRAAPPDLGALRRFLRALRADNHVVVRVVRQD